MRNVWFWVVLVLVALGVGFFGWRISSLASKVEELDKQLTQQIEELRQLAALGPNVEELDKRLTQQIEELKDGIKLGQLAKLRIAFVRSPEEVMLKYKGTEERVKKFREERAKRQDEIDALQKKFERGEISRRELEDRVNRLQMELAALDQQLTNEIADKILAAVNEIGREKAYDMILKRKDVVLFYKEGLLEDITDLVIERMNIAHK